MPKQCLITTCDRIELHFHNIFSLQMTRPCSVLQVIFGDSRRKKAWYRLSSHLIHASSSAIQFRTAVIRRPLIDGSSLRCGISCTVVNISHTRGKSSAKPLIIVSKMEILHSVLHYFLTLGTVSYISFQNLPLNMQGYVRVNAICLR